MREEFYRENARPGCRRCGGSGNFRAVTSDKKQIDEPCECVLKRVRSEQRKMNKYADML